MSYSKNTITILTPCSRQKNLPTLLNSIDFDKIDKWIIIYDTSKNRTYEKLYTDHPKILEVECDTSGVVGHPQRNYGMSLVEDGFIYFLDDDTIVHPNLWTLIDTLDPQFFYTFDQQREQNGQLLHGDTIQVRRIDTAMFLVHKNHIGDIQWHTDRYDADGYFICDIKNKNTDCHRYVNKVCSYYNYLCWT